NFLNMEVSSIALTVELAGWTGSEWTSGEDRRTSGTFQCDLEPGAWNGGYRLEHAGRPGCKEPNDNSGRRGRRRGRRTAEVAMVACVAGCGERARRGLILSRVDVSAAMADDRKRVDRGCRRNGRRSAPQGAVQGDRCDCDNAQDPSEACTHALLGPRRRSSRL